MVSPEATKLIKKIQGDIERNGLIINTIIEDLKALRPFAITEQDPSLTKVIRLTYEHIEENQGFDIAIPEEEEEETEMEETPVEEEVKPELTDAEKKESLEYLIAIMNDAQRKSNRVDLLAYRDALMEY